MRKYKCRSYLKKGAKRQQGVTLIVGLIMLVLISLMVTTAFTLSTTNLKAVGNMQSRNEAIAAANKAVEQVISTHFEAGFMDVPPSQTVSTDMNHDGTPDYRVKIGSEVPPNSGNWVGAVCLQANLTDTSANAGKMSSVEGPSNDTFYSTLWEVDAVVSDPISGVSTRIRQGVRIELGQIQRDAVCP